MGVRAALKEAMARLAAAQVPSHALAAELLLMHALGRDRAWLYAHPEEMLDSAAAQKYFGFLTRRAAGEPTQYITGKQEFWGLELEVTPAVLIPRPETEHVVEVALERLRQRPGHQLDGPLRVADVGTGSGCLAVALAKELPRAGILATDISGGALEVARRNAMRHGVASSIQFVCANLLDAFLIPLPACPEAEGRRGARHASLLFDLMVSNPPYVAREEAAELPREVREHEPHQALFGGRSGFEVYPQLASQAAELLRPGGILVLEIGYDSAVRVRNIFERDLRWSHVAVTTDLAGIERVLAAERT